MRNYYVLLKPETDALLLIPGSSPDLLDYQLQGFQIQHEGKISSCKEWIYEYWDGNYVPDEKRIYSTHKN